MAEFVIVYHIILGDLHAQNIFAIIYLYIDDETDESSRNRIRLCCFQLQPVKEEDNLENDDYVYDHCYLTIGDTQCRAVTNISICFN